MTEVYRHPGYVFLSRYGSLCREEDIYLYIDFLRRESGMSDDPPIDLSRIYECFGIPTPVRVPLDEQQGILLDSSTGMILIKEDDPIVRQRFTEGHELMELLFDAQAETALSQWSEQQKERWCDRGAADLLMPRSSFIPRLNDLGVSLNTARSLSAIYQTSLIATLVRIIEQCSGNFALVMWHYDLKPTEKRQKNTSLKAEKKLRVWWRVQSQEWAGGFIPKNKSATPDSLISRTHVEGKPCIGNGMIDFGVAPIECQIEAMPMTIGDKPCVLSLLHCIQ